MQVPAIISVWDDGYGISVGNEYQMTKEQLEYELGMSSTEVELLLSDSVLTARNSKEWKYNKRYYQISLCI